MSNPQETSAISRDALQALNEVAHNTSALFQDFEDIEQVNKIHSALENTRSNRSREVDTQRATLKVLARQFEAQKAACVRPANVPTEAQQQERLSQLDQQKFALGKAIASLEQELASKEGRLAGVKVEASHSDLPQDTEEYGQDTEVLRLKIYRDLGFTPVRDGQGHYSSMLVSSASRNELHTIPLTNQSSTFALCNKLWSHVS